MYLLVTSRKGISSMQLAKQIGVTQKSAWFMLQRLREACGNDPTALLAHPQHRSLADRPKDKGVAATKMRDQIKKAERKAKREEWE